MLDGAVDFLLPAEELSAGQAAGFENALDELRRMVRGRVGLPAVLERRDRPSRRSTTGHRWRAIA